MPLSNATMEPLPSVTSTISTTSVSSSSVSQVIPIRCDEMIRTKPPVWTLIEINGQLLPPIELPDTSSSQMILDQENHVELGQLSFVDPKVNGKLR